MAIWGPLIVQCCQNVYCMSLKTSKRLLLSSCCPTQKSYNDDCCDVGSDITGWWWWLLWCRGSDVTTSRGLLEVECPDGITFSLFHVMHTGMLTVQATILTLPYLFDYKVVTVIRRGVSWRTQEKEKGLHTTIRWKNELENFNSHLQKWHKRELYKFTYVLTTIQQSLAVITWYIRAFLAAGMLQKFPVPSVVQGVQNATFPNWSCYHSFRKLRSLHLKGEVGALHELLRLASAGPKFWSGDAAVRCELL